MGANLPCPAVKELMDCLKTNVPFLDETYKEANGKYLSRLQWQKDGTLNRHDAGLALDMILFSTNFDENQLALGLIQAFKKNRYIMQWRGLIYVHTYIDGLTMNEKRWGADDHLFHVHIDWFDYNLYANTGKTSIPWPPEAVATGFSTLLGADLSQVFNQWQSQANADI